MIQCILQIGIQRFVSNIIDNNPNETQMLIRVNFLMELWFLIIDLITVYHQHQYHHPLILSTIVFDSDGKDVESPANDVLKCEFDVVIVASRAVILIFLV